MVSAVAILLCACASGAAYSNPNSCELARTYRRGRHTLLFRPSEGHLGRERGGSEGWPFQRAVFRACMPLSGAVNCVPSVCRRLFACYCLLYFKVIFFLWLFELVPVVLGMCV